MKIENADNEIDIFVVDGNDKKYMIEIFPTIKCMDLIKKIESFFKNYYFDIVYRDKLYTIANKNDIINLEQGDTIYIVNNIKKDSNQNIKFDLNKQINQTDIKKGKLSEFLKLFLIKYIAENIDIKAIDSNQTKIRKIIEYLNNEMTFKADENKDIKVHLVDNLGNNIISYSNYVNSIIGEKEIFYLINICKKNKKNEFEQLWNALSEYEIYCKLFEKQFLEYLKNSYFEFSLVGISIYEQNNRQNYQKGFKQYLNKDVKYLFHGTQTDIKSKNIIEGFHYSRKPLYGVGLYFSDMLDYISFFSGRNTLGKTLSVGSTFSCSTAEIYYIKELKEDIYDNKYAINELDHFPTYQELYKFYHNQMVKKYGVNFVRIDPNTGEVKNKQEIISERKKGKLIVNQYVITEMDQILPLFGLTLKRNEYCIIWRDPTIGYKNKFSEFENNIKMSIYEYAKMNAYFENSIEKALEIVQKKKFNKIILISNIGLDLSGKRFVEIARKILGFDVMVLFFSSNMYHLKWIQNFPNALYTNYLEIIKYYIMNYNENGLIYLKEYIESHYKIKLNFTNTFLKFPKFINEKNCEDIIFDEISDNFKKVKIFNGNKALKMEASRNVTLMQYENNQEDNSFIWYITIIGDEITLYSNMFYLGFNPQTNILNGNDYMEIWKFINSNDEYYFYIINNNTTYILTEYGKDIIIIPKKYNYNGLLFKLV